MYILILSTIAIIGAFSVAFGRPLAANMLWLVSNPAMAVYNYKINEFEMAGMFAVYSMIAVYGVYNLKIKFLINKHRQIRRR